MQSILDLGKSQEEVYVEKLRALGYIVIKPRDLEPTSIKNATQLVDLFYSSLQFHNPGRLLHYSRARKKDLAIASKFIKSRTELSGNKSRALQECATLVATVVKYESLFGFEEPLRSFDVFGHETMKWVIDKAISIVNDENLEASDQELQLYLNELSEKQERESLSNLDDRITRLKKVLGGLDDGKESKERK